MAPESISQAGGGRHVAHRGVFGLEQRTVLGAIGDLEHEAAEVARAKKEVLVALAGQRSGRAVQAVAFARQRLRGGGVEPRGPSEKRHQGDSTAAGSTRAVSR